MDERFCPLCEHKMTRRIHTQAALQESRTQAEAKQTQREAQRSLLPVSEQGKKTRIGKVLVQEYYCICFQQGTELDKDGKRCICCVGPYTEAMRESLYEYWLEYKDMLAGNENHYPTTSDNAGSFVCDLVNASTGVSILQCVCFCFARCILTLFQVGRRDLHRNGMEQTVDSVLGASVDTLARAELSDNQRHAVSVSMGMPTDILPNGQHIGELQRMPRGFRSYNGGLDTTNNPSNARRRSGAGGQRSNRAVSSRTGGSNGAAASTGRGRAQQITPTTHHQTPKGVSRDRTKTKLRSMLVNGTPGTGDAAYETLEDMAKDVKNATTETVYDAEKDGGQSSSQDVAAMAIRVKKKEQEKRKKKKDNNNSNDGGDK